MTLIAQELASRIYPRSVSRINHSYSYSDQDFVANHLKSRAIRLDNELVVQCFAHSALSSGMNSCYQAYAATAKLDGYLTFDIAVDSEMMINNFEWITAIPSNPTDTIVDLSRTIQNPGERLIVVDHNRDCIRHDRINYNYNYITRNLTMFFSGGEQGVIPLYFYG
jgi:hypothetical protein